MASGLDDDLATDPPPAKRPRRTQVDYAKKYWWMPAVAVPIVVALIAIVPDLVGSSSPAGTTTITTTVGDLYFVTNVQTDDPAARAQFDSAIALANAGQFAQAKAIFEQLAPNIKSAAVYNNLAVINAALRNDEAAMKSVEQALQLDPGSEAVRANLDRLAEGRRNPPPGTTLLSPSELSLSTRTESTLVSGTDEHFYSFTTPEGSRDLIDVALVSRSTSLAPALRLYNPQRELFQEGASTTAGAEVRAQFAALPATTYYVAVRSYYDSQTGQYALTVTPRRAFDRYEPNDVILKPATIAKGQDIQAGIMDAEDTDVFQFPVAPGPLRTVLTNRSATLSPNLRLLDSNRASVAQQNNTTPGGHTTVETTVTQAGTWYLTVSSYYDDMGDYTIRIEQ